MMLVDVYPSDGARGSLALEFLLSVRVGYYPSVELCSVRMGPCFTILGLLSVRVSYFPSFDLMWLKVEPFFPLYWTFQPLFGYQWSVGPAETP